MDSQNTPDPVSGAANSPAPPTKTEEQTTPTPPSTPTYLIRLSQSHEDFRLTELQSLSLTEQIPFTILSYSPHHPILLITGPPNPQTAARLVRRATLTQNIYEHWGTGATLADLHANIQQTSSHLWAQYTHAPWKFTLDAFQGTSSPTAAARNALINTFRYLPLAGPISLTNPALELTIFTLHHPKAAQPHTYHLARRLGPGARDLPAKYDLKKRPYISTTSMAADLALLTANMALAAPGKLFYDPFAGTGSFPLACAAFGAVVWGSDIDGRAMRGSGADARAVQQRGKVKGEKTFRGNFVHYGLEGRLGDVFSGDLTHCPLRRVRFACAGKGGRGRLLDGVVCDPPYGVREGLRVLGCRDPEGTPWVVEAGHARYKDPAFIPPKKPYSFNAMLHDILHFASETLVDDGRLAFWMPVANEATPDQEHPIPTHPCLHLESVCVQPFNRWSRRLMTYRRLADETVDPAEVAAWLAAQSAAVARQESGKSGTADDLNPFRKEYFSGFGKDTPPPADG